MHKKVVISIVLTAMALVAYWPARECGFVNIDDDEYVTENRYIQQGLTAESVEWAFTKYWSSNWHPLTWISLMIDSEMSGEGGIDAKVFHTTNIVQHAINSVLLFLVLAWITGATWPSAIVAALFAVHPVRVESVAWVTERKDTLSTMFWLLAMASYAAYVRSKEQRAKSREGGAKREEVGRDLAATWYVVTLVLLGLGLMSKPMLVTLPCVFLLMDWWPLRRLSGTFEHPTSNIEHPIFNWSSWRGVIVEKIPMFALVVISMAVTVYVQSKSGAVKPLEHFPLSTRVDNALLSYVAYIGKNIWPSSLAVFYPYRTNLSLLRTTGAFVLLVTTTWLAFRNAKKHPHILVGWLWYIGTLVPVIGLVQVGNQTMADRYHYVPTIGLYVAAVWTAATWVSGSRFQVPGKKILIAALVVPLLLVLTSLTQKQIEYWRNSIELYEHALAVTEGNWLAHNNIAIALEQEGNHKLAFNHYKRAVEVKYDYTDGLYNYANALAKQGRYREATGYYERVLKLDPDNPDTHTNYGNIQLFRGRVDEAIAHFRTALKLHPPHAEANNNLANALAQKGLDDDAITHYRIALNTRPNYPDARNNLGVALAAKGQYAEAAEQYRMTLQIDPMYLDAHVNMASLYEAQGRRREARDQYMMALQKNPNYQRAKDGLVKLRRRK